MIYELVLVGVVCMLSLIILIIVWTLGVFMGMMRDELRRMSEESPTTDMYYSVRKEEEDNR